MTTPEDAPMRRVLVSGISGAGKTTLARRIEGCLGVPHHELDALYHGPGWVARPEFEAEVERFSAGSAWVTEDQYHSLLGDLLWQRADTVVWLDLPRRTVMQRVVRRSVLRAALRQRLFNGNRERVRTWLQHDHPMRWAWAQHGPRRAHTEERSLRHPDVRVVRLRSAAEVRRWLRSVAPAT